MLNNDLSYVTHIEAPISTYHPSLDTILKYKQDTIAISMLKKQQCEEDKTFFRVQDIHPRNLGYHTQQYKQIQEPNLNTQQLEYQIPLSPIE